jgi:hypothetical protein
MLTVKQLAEYLRLSEGRIRVFLRHEWNDIPCLKERANWGVRRLFNIEVVLEYLYAKYNR